MLDAMRIYFEIPAAHHSLLYDVRLGEYALLVKEGPADKVAAIKGPKAHVSVRHLKDCQLPRDLHPGRHEAREDKERARGGLRAHAGRTGFFGCEVMHGPEAFKAGCDVIVANR